jgi:hypothetical protein
MKIERKNIFSAFLLLILTTVPLTALATPVLAKNMNVPEDTLITYYTGGNASIALPTTLKIPVPGGGLRLVNTIRITGVHVETSSVASGDYILVHFYAPDYLFQWIPWAVFTTSTDPAFLSFWRTFVSGTPIYMPNTFDNVFSGCDLTVDRHGNSITINLATAQDIRIIPASVPSGPLPKLFTLPAFSMELNKVGGSTHDDISTVLTGYAGSSGWTSTQDLMGFNAEGAFTCPDWGYAAKPMVDSFVTMHGIWTFTPP